MRLRSAQGRRRSSAAAGGRDESGANRSEPYSDPRSRRQLSPPATTSSSRPRELRRRRRRGARGADDDLARTYVVASVRRPRTTINGQVGLQDFTTDDVYYERGMNLLHGDLTEYYVEDLQYVFPLPRTLAEVVARRAAPPPLVEGALLGRARPRREARAGARRAREDGGVGGGARRDPRR